jgi:hypothetical protein
MSTVIRGGRNGDANVGGGVAGPGLLAGGRRSLATQQRPRRRSWGVVTLAALLVVGLGLAVAAWGLHAGDRESVLAVGSSITKGQAIERDDLVSTSVAGVSGAFPVTDVDMVAGQTAAVDLVAGQILTDSMVTSDPIPGDGQATVGLALDPTRVPGAGLDPGDPVDVIAVPNADDAKADPVTVDTPEILAEGAEVYAVGGVATPGGQMILTLVVEAEDAARIAAYSTQNRVAVVEAALSSSTADGEDAGQDAGQGGNGGGS